MLAKLTPDLRGPCLPTDEDVAHVRDLLEVDDGIDLGDGEDGGHGRQRQDDHDGADDSGVSSCEW